SLPQAGRGVSRALAVSAAAAPVLSFGGEMTQPLVRWSAIVAIVLMGAALLVTAWSSYTSVVDASATLVRGQADFLEQALRGELGPTPPTSADLDDFLADQSPAGLRYVAAFDPAGAISAQAGAALGGRPSPRRFGPTA